MQSTVIVGSVFSCIQSQIYESVPKPTSSFGLNLLKHLYQLTAQLWEAYFGFIGAFFCLLLETGLILSSIQKKGQAKCHVKLQSWLMKKQSNGLSGCGNIHAKVKPECCMVNLTLDTPILEYTIGMTMKLTQNRGTFIVDQPFTL